MNSLENIMISTDGMETDPCISDGSSAGASANANACANGYFCMFCSRRFHFKDLFDQHNITCEFFYKSRRDKQRESESTEPLPTAQEQYKLIQFLSLQVNKLQKEVIRLKGSTVVKKRKVILEWLQSGAAPLPTCAFEDWIKQMLGSVSLDDLQCVFRGDLTDGLKNCIKTYISSETIDGNVVPMCAFKQKPGTIYVWCKTTVQEVRKQNTAIEGVSASMCACAWSMMQVEQFDRWINRLAHRFLQVFIEWQMTNSALIHSCDEEKEKNVDYMRKINGLGRAYEDRRRGELRKWTFCLLERDFKEMVEWDFV